VERVHVLPQGSRIGPASATERAQVQAASFLSGVYDKAIDRESAYEILAERAAQSASQQASSSTGRPAAPQGSSGTGGGALSDILLGSGRREGVLAAAAKSVARSASSSIGREIVRGILGSLLGGKGKK